MNGHQYDRSFVPRRPGVIDTRAPRASSDDNEPGLSNHNYQERGETRSPRRNPSSSSQGPNEVRSRRENHAEPFDMSQNPFDLLEAIVRDGNGNSYGRSAPPRNGNKQRTPQRSGRTGASPEEQSASARPTPRVNPLADLPSDLPAAAELRILQSYIGLLSESRENEKRARRSSESAYQAALAAKELEIELLGEISRLKDEFRNGAMAELHSMLKEVRKVTAASDCKITELHDILSDIQDMTAAALHQRKARQAKEAEENKKMMSLASELTTLPHKIGNEVNPKLESLKELLDRVQQSLGQAGERQDSGGRRHRLREDELRAAIEQVSELSGGEYVVVRVDARQTSSLRPRRHQEASAPSQTPDENLMDVDKNPRPNRASANTAPQTLSGDDSSSLLDADIDCPDIIGPLHPSFSPHLTNADIMKLSEIIEKNKSATPRSPNARASGEQAVTDRPTTAQHGAAANIAPMAQMYITEPRGIGRPQSGVTSVEEELGVYPGWPGPPLTHGGSTSSQPSPRTPTTTTTHRPGDRPGDRRATPSQYRSSSSSPAEGGGEVITQLNQDFPAEATGVWDNNTDRQAALRDHFIGTGLRPLGGSDTVASVFKYGVQYKPATLTATTAARNVAAFGSVSSSRTLIVSNIPAQTTLSQVLARIHGGPLISAILTTDLHNSHNNPGAQVVVIRFATTHAAHAALASLIGQITTTAIPWKANLSGASTFPENEATLAALRTGRTRCLVVPDFPRELLPTLFRDLHLDFTMRPYRAGVLEEAWYKPTSNATSTFDDQDKLETGSLFLFYASLTEAVSAYTCIVSRRPYADVRKGVRFLEDPCAAAVQDGSGSGSSGGNFSGIVQAEVSALGSLREMSMRGLVWQFANKASLGGGSSSMVAGTASQQQKTPRRVIIPRAATVEDDDEVETGRGGGATLLEEEVVDNDIATLEMLAAEISLGPDEVASSPMMHQQESDDDEVVVVAKPAVEHDMPWTTDEIETFRLRLQCPACRDGHECPLRNQLHHNVLPSDMTDSEMDMLCYPAIMGEHGKMVWELLRREPSPTPE